MIKNKCRGKNKNLRTCGRTGSWRFFCEDHQYQWIILLSFLIFTVWGGGASIYSVMSSDTIIEPSVPGFNNIEKQLNKAKIEGLEYTEASNNTFVAKLFVKSILEEVTVGDEALFAFTSVTPIKSAEGEYVFEAGKCRFIGKGTEFFKDRGYSKVNITLINCVDDSKNSFGFNAEKLGIHRIGYLSLADKPGDPHIPFVKDGYTHTLDSGINYLVNMDNPILSLPRNGKSFERW